MLNKFHLKKLMFILAMLVLTAFRSHGQINFEYTFTGVSSSYINLPSSGYKFYIMDVANNQCRIYNNDYSLWKTINLSLMADYYLCDIQFVTEDLFNTDNSIELLYVSYNYNSTLDYYTYETRIVNETGTVLLSIPGGGYSAIYPSESGSKLFVWVYDYSLTPYTVNTNVYSIPGQYTSDLTNVQEEKLVSLQKAFPNPAVKFTTIPYSLPDYVKQAVLKLYSTSGVQLKSVRVDPSSDNIKVQIDDLQNGIYLYRFESHNYISDSNKLVICK